MDPRRFACLLFLSTVPLVAQGLQGLVPPTPPVPVAVTPKTPEEELAALQREKERLLREIDYVKDRVANQKALLADKFATRGLSVREIDAGRSAATPQPAAPMAPKHARLMSEEELSTHPADVMMLVAGAPISRTTYDQLRAQENPNIDQAVRGQVSLYDLIRIEGIASAFTEGEHEVVLAEVTGRLADGKTVAELAPVFGTVLGADPDGRIEVPHNSRFGPRFEQIAFDLAVGETSRPFKHHTGFVVLHKDSVEKGASPELDKVVAHCLQVPYTPAPDVLQKAQFAVSAAQIEIAVRDKETMMLLPAAFRSPEYAPPPVERTDRRAVLQKSLEILHKEIEEARAAGGDIDKSRLPALEARMQRIKDEIEKLEAAGESDAPPPQEESDEAAMKRQQRIDAAERQRAAERAEKEAAEKTERGEKPQR